MSHSDLATVARAVFIMAFFFNWRSSVVVFLGIWYWKPWNNFNSNHPFLLQRNDKYGFFFKANLWFRFPQSLCLVPALLHTPALALYICNLCILIILYSSFLGTLSYFMLWNYTICMFGIKPWNAEKRECKFAMKSERNTLG